MAEQLTRDKPCKPEPKPGHLPVLTDEVTFWDDALGRLRLARSRLARAFTLRRSIDVLIWSAIGLVLGKGANHLLGEPRTALDCFWWTVAVVVPFGVLIAISERRRKRRTAKTQSQNLES